MDYELTKTKLAELDSQNENEVKFELLQELINAKLTPEFIISQILSKHLKLISSDNI